MKTALATRARPARRLADNFGILMSAPEIPTTAPTAAANRNDRAAAITTVRRDFLGNRFVSVELSPRARGLSIGVNLSPKSTAPTPAPATDPLGAAELDVPVMIRELDHVLALVQSGGLRELPVYQGLPTELLTLRHVALGGEGEPTTSPRFIEAMEAIVHLRALSRRPFFKLILTTNALGIHRPEVAEALRLLTPRDEIWVRLDPDFARAGEAGMPAPDAILHQITTLARQRPINLLAHFSAFRGDHPIGPEIEAYSLRLRALKEAGAQIPLVQIYSDANASAAASRTALPLRTLFDIARHVRTVSGLPVEVF